MPKALFIGGELHGQELEDPGTPTYKHMTNVQPKVMIGRAWKPGYKGDAQVYYRHPDEPVYRLENYKPTEEEIEMVREWLGLLS